MDGLILILFVAAMVFGMFWLIRKIRRVDIYSYLQGKTREDYIAKYPDSVVNGAVKCFKCGEGHWPKSYVLPAGEIVYHHVCTECGTELFRSGSGEETEKIRAKLDDESDRKAFSSN